MARIAVTPPGRSEHSAGSLTSSVNVINDDGRWTTEGVTFRADPCSNTGFVTFCGPEEGNDDKAITESGRILTFDSFFFWEGDRCSVVGTRAREDLAGRLETKLIRNTSNRVEARFEGTVLAANLATDLVATTITGPLGVVEAMYALADALNGDLNGDRGMIHVPQAVAAYLSFYSVVERTAGNILKLANSDHVVVTGTGYQGLGPATTIGGDPVTPAAGTVWAYATSPVEVRVSSVEVFAGDIAGNLNRENNQIEIRAERAAVAYFDRCAHYAVNVCLPDPGPACGAIS